MSCLRENLTISSYGEGLETGRVHRVPRQFLTRQILFNVLKNGCRVEALQLGAMERLERALALFLVVAWRVVHRMHMGRSCPDLDAELFFDTDEIRDTYLLTDVKQPATPKLNEVLRLIARLGGFLGRKGDGEPGAKVIWLGLKEVHVAAKALQKLRAGGHAENCV
ncbi:transposase, IS4 family [Burkholderia ambifaria MEX-5]|uniref:Transposase, IS4 family n=1 Tax=Burkholderia ambifaria MEX-5 TaxID=396597 RepID=B1TD93_9BURK|nr:transposase, IS4 family [Burkholderia ambifaria MEX-5]